MILAGKLTKGKEFPFAETVGICLLSILVAATPAAAGVPDDSAGMEHYFPLVADGGGFRSRLFLTNVSDGANRCALSLRGAGLDAGVFQANDAVALDGAATMVDLGGAGAGATLTTAGDGALIFGRMKLDCDGPAAARMLLSLEDGGTLLSLATLESARPGRSFQFPVLSGLGRLAMVFSNEAGPGAACAAELEDGAGASLGGGNFTVPAASTALNFLDELIPAPDGIGAGKVRVSCDRAVSALGLLLNGSVFTAMPAVALDGGEAGTSRILPLVQDGGGFRSTLLLTNLAETANRCAVDFRGGALGAGRFEIPAGASAAGSSVALELSAQGGQASLSTTGAQGLAYGYAAVECDGPVDARNLLTADAGSGPAGMAVVSAAQSGGGLEFPVAPGLGRLALAMSNDAESAVSCAVELRTDGGTIADTGPFPVAGRSTSVRFLGDLFAVLEGFPGGTARLSCSSGIAATSLLAADKVFAALPPAVLRFRTTSGNAQSQPATVVVDPARVELFAPGATVQLTAEVRDQSGRVINGAAVSWASGADSAATVNPSGLVTAAGGGTATVTASAGSVSASVEVRVHDFAKLLREFAEEHSIGAAALGIMKDGEIVYDGAVGHMDEERQSPIVENVTMRIASVSKPITAAAVHKLAGDGMLDLDDRVFDLGQTGGGLLRLDPFPRLGDERLAEITVLDLLRHRGGWDRGTAGDLSFRDVEIAQAMGISSPPGRENTVRYILGQPLQFDPGSRRAYANIGYLVLGLIVEEVSGEDYMTYALENIFDPLGVPRGDVVQGRTFPGDRSDREPWYDSAGMRCRNVFDPSGPAVGCSEGGWDHEAIIAVGGLVASTRALLAFADAYVVAGDDIGRPLAGREGWGSRWRWRHSGSLTGTNTLLRQGGDGISYAVLFNRRLPPSSDSSGAKLYELFSDIIEGQLANR